MSEESDQPSRRPPERRGAGGEVPYRAPRLICHGPISEIVRGGEGTNPDGGGFFAFSGAEP